MFLNSFMPPFVSNSFRWIRRKANRLRFWIVALSLLGVAYVGCFFLLIIRGENMFAEIPKLPTRRRFRKDLEKFAKNYAENSEWHHFLNRKQAP